MPHVQEYFARGRLAAVCSRSGRWEFRLASSGLLPREGRFCIEPGRNYLDNFCTLLLTARAADRFEIVVKTTTPISSQGPAVVDRMRAVQRMMQGDSGIQRKAV
jgi:hypothetical protein